MARQLIVLLGAGASADCAGVGRRVSANRQPPLVRTLFADDYLDILDRYPLAQAAAADLWPRRENEAEAIALEDYLRDHLLNSPLPHRRAQYWAVPLYLQDLLQECARQFTSHPANYDRLVSALLELERVVFVTLNYDTILDSVIGKYYALESVESYVARSQLALIKLHGSVNWGRALNTVGILNPHANGYGSVCHALAQNPERLSSEIVMRAPAPPPDVESMRRDSAETLYYPALSAPLGAEDEPSCPPLHLDALRSTLDQRAYGYELHLLVIGYSCLDQTPLDLLLQSGSRVASIVVVNGSADHGNDALKRIQDHLGGAGPQAYRGDHVEVFDGGFTAYASPTRLAALVQRVRDA